jgi:hypothetical protein
MGVFLPIASYLRAGQTECMASSLATPDRRGSPCASVPAPPGQARCPPRGSSSSATTGSPGSRAAIAEAARRSDRRERLVIVRALGAGFGDPPTQADRGGYQRAVTSLLAAVRSELHPNVPYELRVVAGDVSSALADVVRRHHGTALVIEDPAGPAGGRPNRATRAPRTRASVPPPEIKTHDREQGEAPRADRVHQCGLESFPASDPPSWWGGSPGT